MRNASKGEETLEGKRGKGENGVEHVNTSTNSAFFIFPVEIVRLMKTQGPQRPRRHLARIPLFHIFINVIVLPVPLTFTQSKYAFDTFVARAA